MCIVKVDARWWCVLTDCSYREGSNVSFPTQWKVRHACGHTRFR
jgi:hypothetical protein